ncbi:hypothetical protein WDZ92_26745 [Nostoc sp. NIES-2111]
MLWRKAWLECRYRFLLCFLMSFSLALSTVLQLEAGTAQKMLGQFGAMAALVGPVGALILAGSGINTQTNWGMMQGFHPSMYFLLSLPVSREKLLRVRATVGLGLTFAWLLGSAVLLGALQWITGQVMDGKAAVQMLPNLFCGTVVYYTFAVWLCAFLDEFWAGMVALTVTGMLAGYGLADGPSWVNMAKFMTSNTLLSLDGSAWLQALTYLAISAVFYWLAKRTVERKEY